MVFLDVKRTTCKGKLLKLITLITDFSAKPIKSKPLSKLFLQISSSIAISYEDSRHCEATF